MSEHVLRMQGISKRFPGVHALDQVQLNVRKGTVHALMGENGAGKSTLMKCLIGIYAPDSGTIELNGEQVRIVNTHHALSMGISMIHQELSPIPHMTVAENIFLGREPLTWYGLVDMRELNRRTRERLRGERFGGPSPTEARSQDLLSEKMAGRDRTAMFHKEETPVGEPILYVRNYSGKRFRDVTFQVRRGEIFGLAGLMGAGRTELLETIFGVHPRTSGEIYLHGKKVEIRRPSDSIRHGLALLTEDRKLTGLYMNATVRDNISIANLLRYMAGPFVRFRKVAADCERMRQALRIKTPSLQQKVRNLSGGNQQKVLLSRWLLTEPEILILDEPTRGIDVGAKAEIYRLMVDLARSGKAIIMISSELPEVLGMCDRIMVMHEGDKVGEVVRGDATQERILQMATGLNLSTANA